MSLDFTDLEAQLRALRAGTAPRPRTPPGFDEQVPIQIDPQNTGLAALYRGQGFYVDAQGRVFQGDVPLTMSRSQTLQGLLSLGLPNLIRPAVTGVSEGGRTALSWLRGLRRPAAYLTGRTAAEALSPYERAGGGVVLRPGPLPALTREAGGILLRPAGTPPPTRFPATPARTPQPLVASETAPFQISKFGGEAVTIEYAGREAEPRIIAQRRGVVSDVQIRAFADELGIRPDELVRLQPGQALSAEHVYEARRILYKSAQAVRQAAAAWQAHPNPQTEAIFTQTWRHHIDLQTGLSGAASEAGRALRIFRQTLQDQPVTAAATEAMSEGLEYPLGRASLGRLAERLARQPATKALGDELRPTWRDMAVEFGTAMKLSGPATHLRNFLGNAAAAFIRPLDEIGAATVEAFRTGFGVLAPRQRFYLEAGRDLVGMASGLPQAARNFLRALASEPSLAQTMRIRETAGAVGRAIPGRLGHVIRLPFRLLYAGDEFWREVNRRGIIMSEALREAARTQAPDVLTTAASLATSPSPAMAQRVGLRVSEYLFQESLGDTAKLAQALRNKSVVARLFFPFFKTPVNIAKFVGRRSPLGVLTLGGARGVEVSDRLGRVLSGSLISAGAVLLAFQGRITGTGPKDARLRNELIASGTWRPQSVRRADGTWQSFAGFEPVTSWLTSAADAIWVLDHEPTYLAQAEQIASRAGQLLLNSTYVTGLRDILEAATDPGGRTAERIASSAVAGFLPRALAPIQRAYDPTLREARTPPEAVLRQIPILSRQVTPRLDPYGRPIQLPGGWQAPAIPFTRVSVPQDPVLAELARLQLTIPEVAARVTHRGRFYEVPPEVQARLAAQRGTRLQPLLGRLMASPSYQRLDDAQKRLRLQRILDRIATRYQPQRQELVPTERVPRR